MLGLWCFNNADCATVRLAAKKPVRQRKAPLPARYRINIRDLNARKAQIIENTLLLDVAALKDAQFAPCEFLGQRRPTQRIPEFAVAIVTEARC